MLGNWLKTAILMAAIVALFGAAGGAPGGSSGMMMALMLAAGMMCGLANWGSPLRASCAAHHHGRQSNSP